MSDIEHNLPPIEPAPEASEAPLSAIQRVLYIFTSPTKTFLDIKRSSNWWLPLILVSVFSYGLCFAIQTQIGWKTVTENQMKQASAAQQERLDKLSPDMREKQLSISAAVTQGVFLAMPLFTAVAFLFFGLLDWATLNFGFGAKAKFGQVTSVVAYASLPGIVKTVLGIVAIYATPNPDAFSLKNFAPTNIAYALNPAETSKPLYALLNSLDAVTIWTLILAGLGLSVVANVKKSTGQIVVWAWFALFTLIGVGIAALQS